jgi:hypothetical protein
MTRLDELERLARAATPGPWSAESQFRVKHRRGYRAWDDVAQTMTSDDSAYIAALSPEVVLALIDVVRAADEMRAERQNSTYIPVAAIAAFDAARARLGEAND